MAVAPGVGIAGRAVDRWRRFRNRLVADPRFQRFAADLPLVRRVAGDHANALFDLTAGFVYSQILLACVELAVFEAVAEEPLAVCDLAARIGLAPEAASRLADAAVALGLLDRRSGGRIGLGLLGAALRGTPGLAAMIRHHAVLYRDLADPVAVLRAGRADGLGGFWPYAAGGAGEDGDAAARYSGLMAATQGFVQADILDAHPFHRHRAVLDVGGGDGSFLAALRRRAPHLALHLFDLPPVAALAAARFAGAAGEGPVTVHAGDFRRDDLPTGADLVTLVRVVHDHDDATVRGLFSAVHRALPPGGRILVAEPMADAPGARRMGDAYFGLYLYAMGRGRPRSAATLAGLLAAAGFERVRALRTRRPLLVSAVVAERR